MRVILRWLIPNTFELALSAALAAKHPKQFSRPGYHILVRSIVESALRLVPRPAVPEGPGGVTVAARIDDDAAERAVDAAQRAAERLARMRGL